MDIEKTNANPPREKLFLLWNSIQRILPDLNVDDSKRAEDHENRIRRHYNQLLSNLSVPDVVTQMFQSGQLTPKEHEHLRQFYSTPIRASEELLNFVMINSTEVYECFLLSLKKTKQHHVHQMLTSHVQSESVCLGEESVSEHSRLIRQNYDWLTEKLDPDYGLLGTLYAQEVLSHREHVQIVSERDRFVKNEILLSIISRKSTEDFKKFKIALNDTSQGYITNRLTEMPIGAAEQNVTTAVEKTFPVTRSVSSEKRIPPQPPPKPKKQPPAYTLPSSKPLDIKPKPLRKLKIQLSNPKVTRIEKRQNSTKDEMVKKQSIEYLEKKFRKLPNEFQSEVSTKIFLIHQKRSTDIVWKITFTKILEESRNLKRHSIIQAKAAEENCERLLQEIARRERECSIIREDNQRERTKTKTQLREIQEKVYELQDRLDLTENENKNLLEKLRKSKVEVDKLKVLNIRHAQEVDEKAMIIEKLSGQVASSEVKVQEREEQLRETSAKLIDNNLALKETTTKLEEVQEMLKEIEAQKNEFEAKQNDTEMGTENLKPHDNRDAYLNLEQKLQIERTENDRLNKQTEQCKRLIANMRYKLHPVLVQTIITNAEDGGKKTVFGLAILENELFIVSWHHSEIEVYDSMTLNLSRHFNLEESIGPLDIVSCSRNKCLYIFDGKGRTGQSKEILRVDPNGKLIMKWSTGEDWGYGLSVTYESNVLSVVCNKHKLKEYSPDGCLIREIDLSSHAGIHHPFHAIKLINNHFLVTHGEVRDDLHRVCIVDSDGNLKKSFGGKRGSTTEQVNKPFYLSVDVNGFVMVADQMNNRVLLLNSDLEFKREILSRERKHTLRCPTKILLDETNGRLLVFDNEPDNPKILVFDY